MSDTNGQTLSPDIFEGIDPRDPLLTSRLTTDDDPDLANVLGDVARVAFFTHGRNSWLTIGRELAEIVHRRAATEYEGTTSLDQVAILEAYERGVKKGRIYGEKTAQQNMRTALGL